MIRNATLSTVYPLLNLEVTGMPASKKQGDSSNKAAENQDMAGRYSCMHA